MPGLEITLEPRPHYCDRGNWIAKVHVGLNCPTEIDSQDGWPRYYFDFDRAKLEIEAWLKKRGLKPIRTVIEGEGLQ